MRSRITAILPGLVTGAGLALALWYGWTDVAPHFGLSLAGIPTLRAAATGAVAIGGFTVAASVAAAILGLAEISGARRSLDAIRTEGTSGASVAADWRAAFTRTAVADRAEAAVATIETLPAARRVGVDTTLLLGLDDVWLDRLSLAALVGPLGPLTLGAGALATATAAAVDEAWIPVAAIAAGAWLAVRLPQYLCRLTLAPAVVRTIDAALAALKPLTAVTVPERGTPHVTASLAPSATIVAGSAATDATALGAAVSEALEPSLSKLADAADRMAAQAAPARDQTIDAALAEIRAGIERLLEESDRRTD